jgi:L-galactono-1,4-lactone dehydrogenase
MLLVQVGAHGTGASIPPMDEQVVALTLVTPGRGTLQLSQDDPDPCAPRSSGFRVCFALSQLRRCASSSAGSICFAGCSLFPAFILHGAMGTCCCRSLFYMARVGLGSLGVISEVTLQTVPAQQLLEHTFVSSMQASWRAGDGLQLSQHM